jgi:integrase/recombinase XerD
MAENLLNQWTITKVFGEDYINDWAEAFLIDKKVQNLSPGTIHFYKSKIKLFLEYCDGIALKHIHQITPNILRKYLLYLEEKGHNPGGVHACYRTLRTFLNWWERETEPEEYKNPTKKVKAPKVAVKPLEPVSITQVEALVETCERKDFYDLRDKALLLFLLDTGARAAETCAVNLEDIDLQNGSILIRSGKGGKPRTVFLGKKSRRALRSYLKTRAKQNEMSYSSALWVTQKQSQLTYWGLNQIIRRRAIKASIEKPSLHDFRRAFALNYLRNGGDIYSLQKLMGHADLQVLRRYLAQTNEDLHIAHCNYSPVDNSDL